MNNKIELKRLEIMEEWMKQQNTNVKWVFKCEGYIAPYYNCRNDLKFENITGQYCNSTLVCGNKFEMIKR